VSAFEEAKKLNFWNGQDDSVNVPTSALDCFNHSDRFMIAYTGRIIMTYAVNNLLQGNGMLINQVPIGCENNCSICLNPLRGAEEDGTGPPEKPVVVCPFSKGKHGFHAECIAPSILKSNQVVISCETCGGKQYFASSADRKNYFSAPELQ
jgi:hypothetical protein